MQEREKELVFKVEPNKHKESKQEQGANMKQVILEIVNILLRGGNI